MCRNCETKPVIFLTNNKKGLFKSCFFRYFERKFSRTISQFKLIEPNEKIGVAISGGKDSLTLLYLLNKLKSKKRFRIEALLIDEGINGVKERLFGVPPQGSLPPLPVAEQALKLIG